VPSNGGVEHLESAATLKADDVLKTGELNGEVQATLEDAQEHEGANGN